jgi:hypothetical protein
MTNRKGKAKEDGAFLDSWVVNHGLRITARDASGNVVSALCQFCAHYGREVKTGSKRAMMTAHKYFTPAYKQSNIVAHMKDQHPIAYEDYSKLGEEDKRTHFDKKKQQGLDKYMDFTKEAIVFSLSAAIVENIIGDLFFHPKEDEEEEDDEAISKENALKLFNRQSDDSYRVSISNPLRFKMAVLHTSIGLSFRQTAGILAQYKTELKNPKLGGLNDHIVGQYIRVLVGANLQVMMDILKTDKVWAFSIAGDGSTHHGVSFFDLRIRFCLHGELHNLHLVVVPFFERHTANNITQLICTLLDNLCPRWRKKLIAATTDGENTMTGCIRGVVTQLDNEAHFHVGILLVFVN